MHVMFVIDHLLRYISTSEPLYERGLFNADKSGTRIIEISRRRSWRAERTGRNVPELCPANTVGACDPNIGRQADPVFSDQCFS